MQIHRNSRIECLDFLCKVNMQPCSVRLYLMFLYLAWLAADNYFSFMNFNTCFTEGANTSKPGCPSTCSDLTVSYPFGIGINSSCSINPFFAINCDTSFNPPKPFLTTADLEVLGIFDSKIRVKTRLAMTCYNQAGHPTAETDFLMNLTSTPFSFSNENKLTVVGCDDSAYLSRDPGDDNNWPDLISSCSAICSKPGELSNGICSGIGCCQSSIPEGLQSTYVSMDTDKGHVNVQNFSSCGYSFLAENISYDFNISDISDSSFVRRTIENVPIVIDWAISNQTCNQVRTTGEILCQPNSVCVDSPSTLGGYHCKCSPGYQGNPYLSPGEEASRASEHSAELCAASPLSDCIFQQLSLWKTKFLQTILGRDCTSLCQTLS